MSHCVFTGNTLHFTPHGGMNKLILEDWSESSDFISYYEQRNVAHNLTLGKCIKEFNKFTETSAKRAQELVEKHHANSDTVDYVNAGQDGYFVVSAKVSSNKKRGQHYFVAIKIDKNLFLSDKEFSKVRITGKNNDFNSKKDAEEAAIIYSLQNPEKTVYVINEKDAAVSRVYFETKHYSKKPALIEKTWRKIYPAYRYYYSGDCYVG